MKTLALPPYPASFLHHKNVQKKSETPKIPLIKQEQQAITKPVKRFFDPDSKENLTVKECAIRLALVVTMPMLSAIDWDHGTHTLIFIVPAIFYLEVTAFTMSCPIKALFSNYSHPIKYE